MERDRETDFDIIVAGAGHNGLVTAAYVAMAGLRVLVLEDRPIVGGNAVTEEHIPGYHFDTGSSSHSMIQSTPILKDDELGLLKHGLRYAFPEVLPIAILPDGHALEIHHSVEETARNIAQISRADADAYLNFEAEAREMAAVAGALGRTSIGDVDVSPEIRRKLSRRAWDVIAQRFSDPRIQSWLCQEASISLTPPDQAGTARFVYSAYVGRHSSNSSWGTALPGFLSTATVLTASSVRTVPGLLPTKPLSRASTSNTSSIWSPRLHFHRSSALRWTTMCPGFRSGPRTSLPTRLRDLSDPTVSTPKPWRHSYLARWPTHLVGETEHSSNNQACTRQ